MRYHIYARDGLCRTLTLGVNPRTVQKIEAGKLNILATTLVRIQTALRCRWEELMKGDDVP